MPSSGRRARLRMALGLGTPAHSSMRGRLVLFFLAAVLLPFGLGTVMSELLIERHVGNLVSLAGSDRIEPMLARLADQGRSAERALEQLAQGPEVVVAFAARDVAALDRRLRQMNQVQRMDVLLAVGPDGELLSATAPLGQGGWSPSPALVAAVRGKGGVSYEELPLAPGARAAAQLVASEASPGSALVQLAVVPVAGPAGPLGALLGATRLSGNTALCSALAEGTSSVGTLIAHRQRWVAGAGDAASVGLVGSALDPGQRAALAGRRSWLGPSLHGDAVFTSLVPLASSSGEVVGGLGARVDVSELGALRSSARRAFLLALSVGAALCLLLGRLVVRRTLAPLRRLVSAAGDMERGRLDVSIASEGDDEVAQLGAAMRRTAAALGEAMATLESRVQQRTHEIEVARDREQGLNRELAHRNEELTTQGVELEQQRRELEEKTRRSEEADRLKSAFIANMSHEIRTPLNSVLALSQLLKDGMAGAITTEQRKYVEVIERNGQNLLRLISDILDLSRIEAGHMEMEFEATDLSVLIRTAAGELGPLADAKGLDLVVKVPEGLPLCRCDPDRVRQVLTNLIGNAIKFTEHGQVLLSAELVDGHGRGKQAGNPGMVAVHVTDTGIGIPEGARSRVFEEFFQVDQTLARRRGGTGLGLAIAGRLVNLMGGEISVESVVGAGSRFTFTLPESEGAVAGVPEFGASEGQHPLAGEVLLVDGDGGERRRLGALLEGAGLHVGVAASGDEALARLRTGRYDAMVLDLGLSQPDALEVIDQLRRNPRLGDLAVVGLAAADLDTAARERLGSPVVAVLSRGEALPRALVASLRKTLGVRAGGGRLGQAEAGAPPRDAKVLVVEDNEDNLFTLRQMLTPLGLDVVAVATGREAIDYCRARLPDLVLMDVQLPGMSGLQATGAIRTLPGGLTIPIVALTAQAMKGDRERILAAGCDEYLSKPIQPKMLVALVRRLLARRGETASDARPPGARDEQHGTHTPGR